MRFSSIRLTNYRQYEDLFIEFEYGSHDLHVLIGENGTGKTNLLNAFTWCLYGVEPHLGTEDIKRGEPRLAKEAIRKALRDGRSEAEIRVSIEIELPDEVDRITHSVKVLVRSRQNVIEKKPSEQLVVQRMSASGTSRTLRSSEADDYINRIRPLGIREYFFFDGEHLSNYFMELRSDAVKGAIHSIAQIDVITRMRDRTKNTVRDLNRQAGKEVTGLSELQKRYDDEMKKATSAERAIDNYQEQIRKANIRIGELSDSLRGIPDIAKLEKQRTALMTTQKRNEDELKEAERAYVVFARNAYIDFAFFEVASSTLAAIQEMEAKQQLPPAIDRSYLAEMLADGVCKVCGRPLTEHDQEHLSELLEQFRVSSVTSHMLVGMRSELRRLKDRVKGYAAQRDTVIARLQRAQESLEETEGELADVNEQIVAFPNAEKIKEWYDERKKLEEQVKTCSERIGSKKRGKEIAEQNAEKAKRQHATLLNKANKQKDIAKAVAFGDRAVKILETVEQEVITEVRDRMSLRTETLFKELVWKDSKCDHVALDDTFRLALYDRAGYSCEGTCSAAERALLALSFTLAMHEVSGFESPLFIDTPIARASGESRANFAKILADVSTHKQLILTFTPDEYSEAISVVFDEIAATNQTLALDESEQKVTIRSNNG